MTTRKQQDGEKEELAVRKNCGYNGDTETVHREEKPAMTELVQRLGAIDIPPHILRQLGLDKDWQKKAPPELTKRIIETAQKYREVLRELSKY